MALEDDPSRRAIWQKKKWGGSIAKKEKRLGSCPTPQTRRKKKIQDPAFADTGPAKKKSCEGMGREKKRREFSRGSGAAGKGKQKGHRRTVHTQTQESNSIRTTSRTL